MLVPIEGFADNIVALQGVGTVTADDYRDVLVPAISAATSGDRKARLLLEMGTEFEGYDAGALMADAGVGITHLGSFERVAIVTDTEWLRGAVHIFGGLIPGEFRLFRTGESEAARAWIRG